MESLTITGFSTALFSTWYFVDELSILFDCGDGVSAGLLQKTRKTKHVFISHADRDHCGGLVQFHQLTARDGLNIYYPKSSGSFPALEEFVGKFDPQVSGAKWIPVTAGDEILIRNDLVIRAVENRHVPKVNDAHTKSLSYFVDRRSRKLKPEFLELPGPEIGKLRSELGEEHVSTESRTCLLAYSGDTPIETDGRWDDVETLIHEATFLTAAEIDPDNPHRNKHTSLDQILDVVAGSKIKRLILGHFSSRYSNETIIEAITSGCAERGISIPVYCLLPGELTRNLLSEEKCL